MERVSRGLLTCGSLERKRRPRKLWFEEMEEVLDEVLEKLDVRDW